MSLSCHGALQELRADVDLSVALAGNPNVGKSCIFNHLTGMGVATANYPGKTVEVQLAVTRLGDRKIGIIDLPGTYALGGVSEDQWVARQALLDTIHTLAGALAVENRLPEPPALPDALQPPLSHLWREALPTLRAFVDNPSSPWKSARRP